MGMPAQQTEWTADMARALPDDGKRYEVLDGELFVTPSRDWRDISSLLVAIEVLSPSTARADRQCKRQIYQSEGVPEYWIVDSDARVVERWRPEDERPEIIADVLEWHPRPDVEALSIQLETLFSDLLD
jgi:Uma2 family endonuclease